LSNFNYYLQNKELDRKTFLERLNIVKKFSKNGNVLDIGSSIGTFMSVAKEFGFNPYGMELNQKSAKFSEKTYGFKLFGDYKNIKIKFDFINLGDVIEHFTNPKKELEKINDLLKDNGIILISTPNFNNKLTNKTSIKPFEHLYYFTPKTITSLLESCGFEILYLKPTTRKLSIKTLKYSSTFNKSKIKIALLNMLIYSKLYVFFDFIINRLNPDMLVIAKKLDK
jgi:2-polyprenyl-3-methyl-5-hydroxy-6-metoxy-1,4-benzoquinol methylase